MRGLFPEDLNGGNISDIIHAFHQTLKKGDIAIARDNRPTGKAMEQIVSGILLSMGRNVHNLGLVPTPTIKAFVNEKNLAGGIMISASHNPVQYTAFKFIMQNGFFFDSGANNLLRKNIGLDLKNDQWGNYKNQGNLSDAHDMAIDLHINSIFKKVFPKGVPQKTNLKVAIDTLGACATGIADKFLAKTGVRFVSLFPEVCYDFPRPPEPVEKSLKKLSAFVLKEKCDLGFAFDPDADRLALVDHMGKAIGEELTLPIAMLEALNRKKGNVVVNLSSSLYNESAAESLGSKVYRSKVGEANVVELMRTRKAVFGGEGNGGVIDPDIPSFGRDSISAMAWILAHMMRTKKSLNQIVSEFKPYFMKKEVIKAPAESVNIISQQFKKSFPDWILNSSDGFHFISPEKNAWLHIRSSNTEPVIRVIAEADSKSLLNQILACVKSQ